jgi:hypothetical protein
MRSNLCTCFPRIVNEGVRYFIRLSGQDFTEPTSAADALAPLSANKASLAFFRFCIRDLHNAVAFSRYGIASLILDDDSKAQNMRRFLD